MEAPFVLVTTHAIDDGKLEAFQSQHDEFIDFLATNEPGLESFHAYTDTASTEVTFVFVFADAEAADSHMTAAGELIARGLEITTTLHLEVYGTPGPVLEGVLRHNADLGIPVRVKGRHVGGFTRAGVH